MKISSASTIGRIVLDYPNSADIFEEYDIDFCCKGQRTLGAVCKEKGLSFVQFSEMLENRINTRQGDEQSNPPMDFRSWPLDLLADYIEKKHHRYVNENLLVLTRYLEKIRNVHGQAHPELSEIDEIFKESAGELTKHMKKEELILFPFIRKIVKMKNKGEHITNLSAAGAVENPVRMMMHDHDAEGARFRRIAELTDNYTIPRDACATYKATLEKLKEFEKDLHQHIHLENNLLFPGAINAEKQLIS